MRRETARQTRHAHRPVRKPPPVDEKFLQADALVVVLGVLDRVANRRFELAQRSWKHLHAGTPDEPVMEAGDGVDGGRQRAAKAGLAVGGARGAEEGDDASPEQLKEHEAAAPAAKGHLAALAHRAEAPLFGHGMEGGELVDAVGGRVQRAFLLGRGLQRIEVPLHCARHCNFRALHSFYDA